MKAMRKLLVVLLVIAGAAGCDSTRRDFSQCDQTYSVCLKGYTCDLNQGLCVPDNGQPDAASPSVDATATDAAIVADAAPDAPVVDTAQADAPPALDVAADVAIDIAQPVDLATPDLRVPDAQGTCSVDNDCVGVAGGAFCVADKCVACKTNGQCNNDAGLPFCSAQNTCVSCATAVVDGGSGCPASAPECDPGSGRCVQCVQNSDCPTASKAFCVQNQCVGCDSVPAGTGGNDAGVSSDGGSSDGGTAGTGPCTGATPVCATAANTTNATIIGQCVGCASNADCSGSTPICSAANRCTACTSDTQCASGPGVCMFHQDGRCASDAETIYVQNSTSPAACPGVGTSASPFCQSQDAITAVTANRRLIVMSGPTLFPITSTATTSIGQITIIGQNGATTSAGAFSGVHVTAGDVFLRGLTIANGSNTGITVEAGATLRMDRCIVKGNKGGLLVNSGAQFDIANSVFDSNLSASDGQGRFYGGVLLAATPSAGKTTRFWFNTVLNNQDKGVLCVSTSQSLDGVLLTENINGDQGNCSFPTLGIPPNTYTTSESGATDTRAQPFDPNKPYHLLKTLSLSTSSPCIDFIKDTSVAYPPDDMDGQLRPYGAGVDCGADEYWP